jgi:hypothetical protein
LAALTLPIDILNTGYLSGLTGLSVAPDELLIAFLPASLAELRTRFEWSTLRVYELNARGRTMDFCSGARAGRHR